MQDDTFAQLVEQANAGDSAAYGVLYTTFFTPIYRYLYARTLDRDIASDVAQDTFVKVYEQIQKRPIVSETLQTYLFTIARNTLYDWYRKKRPDFFSDEEVLIDGSPTPFELSITREFSENLEATLTRLPGMYRDVFVLRALEDRSYEDIASITKAAVATVRKQYSRACEMLRVHYPYES